MSKSYRLVSLFARWSNDHWQEMNDGSQRAQAMDQGPDGYEHVLSATFDHQPSPDEIVVALSASNDVLGNDDGKSELREYAVMDEAAWLLFLGPEAKWFKDDGSEESPTIHHHGGLQSAREPADRSGATFLEAAA